MRADRVRPKRVDAPASSEDGTRVLVERLRPRGVTKAAAALDAWAKYLSPSPELGAGTPATRRAGRSSSGAIVRSSRRPSRRLRETAGAGRLALVFAAHDAAQSSAAVLREVLIGRDQDSRPDRAGSSDPEP